MIGLMEWQHLADSVLGFIGNVAEWVEVRVDGKCYQDDYSSKPVLVALLCPWKRDFMVLSSARWS